jgi:hypothetical protein
MVWSLNTTIPKTTNKVQVLVAHQSMDIRRGEEELVAVVKTGRFLGDVEVLLLLLWKVGRMLMVLVVLLVCYNVKKWMYAMMLLVVGCRKEDGILELALLGSRRLQWNGDATTNANRGDTVV